MVRLHDDVSGNNHHSLLLPGVGRRRLALSVVRELTDVHAAVMTFAEIFTTALGDRSTTWGGPSRLADSGSHEFVRRR